MHSIIQNLEVKIYVI